MIIVLYGIPCRNAGISQYALINQGIDKHTLDQLRKNQNVTVLTIEKLCNILDCTPNDIFAFKKEA